MSTYPIASGSVFAKRAGLGPTNQEFVVTDAGQVTFNIGTPSATVTAAFPDLSAPDFSTSTSTGISSSTQNVDAIQKLDNWLDKYLLDSPPAPTYVSSGSDTQKMYVTFTNPPQKKLAFSATAVPLIKEAKADIILSSANGDHLFTGATTITMETITGSNFASVTTLELYVDAGTNTLSGTTYKRYSAVATEVYYDIRIYYTNESSAANKYIEVYGLKTLPIGVPVEPTSLTVSSTTKTLANIAWTKPVDHDSNTVGNQTTPYVSTYKISREATSSVRYGGAIADTGDSFTTTTSGSNSATSASVSSLHPGTTYTLTVSAKNSINANYGPASSSNTATTLLPTIPTFLSSSDATALNSVTTLQSPYSTSGGYSLDGTTASTPILNYSALSNTNLRTPSVTTRGTNLTAGATGTVGSLVALAGPSSTYTDAANKATLSTQGFGTTTPNSNTTSTSGFTTLYYSNDVDAYASGSTDEQGFYKTIDCYACASNVTTAFVASTSPYSMRLQYTPVGGSLLQTNELKFYVDDAGTSTAINNLGVIAEVATGTMRISGVPTFTTTANLQIQFNQSEIAHYFIRQDKKHTDVLLTTSSGTALSNTVTVAQTSMGSSHKYWSTPGTKYNTSSTLHNSTGLALAASSTPEEVQFRDFFVTFSSAAANVFNEGLLIKATPYSLFSNSGGTQVSSSYLDVSTGSTLSLRIDTQSINNNRASSSYANSSAGQHVSSGTGTYPSTGYGADYDHSVDITGTSDLQLCAGVYQTPAYSANSYKNYSTFWCGGLSQPNYSSITSASSSYRFVCFKYSGRIASGSYSKVRLALVQSGLSVDFNSVNAANHILQLKVDDATYGTGWMDATNAVSALGVSSGPDGTTCVSIETSTASQRDCIIRTGSGSTCVFYVRVGIPCNVAASITSISLTPMTTF